MKSDKATPVTLSPEAISALRDVKKRVDSGEESDPQIIEALEAIEIASRAINTIMSGNQIDPVFFKQLSELTQEKIIGKSKIIKPKKLKKKKRFKKLIKKRDSEESP